MSHISKQSGVAHLLVLFLVIAPVGAYTLSKVPVTKNHSISLAQNNVLGEEDEIGKKETERVKEERREEKREIKIDEKKERKNEATRAEIRSETKEGTRTKTKVEDNKRETEVETEDGQKIKTKVEDDGSTKIEYEKDRLKIKYVNENGKVRIKAENTEGKEVELEDDELDSLESKMKAKVEERGIEISDREGKTLVKRNKVSARTAFPLTINPETNELTVTTPAGEKVVTILPDQAVSRMLSLGVLTQVRADDGTTTDNTNVDTSLDIEVKNDQVVYKVKGKKLKKILGVIPVNTEKTAFVSAETGSLVAEEQSLLSSLADKISF